MLAKILSFYMPLGTPTATTQRLVLIKSKWEKNCKITINRGLFIMPRLHLLNGFNDPNHETSILNGCFPIWIAFLTPLSSDIFSRLWLTRKKCHEFRMIGSDVNASLSNSFARGDVIKNTRVDWLPQNNRQWLSVLTRVAPYENMLVKTTVHSVNHEPHTSSHIAIIRRVDSSDWKKNMAYVLKIRSGTGHNWANTARKFNIL